LEKTFKGYKMDLFEAQIMQKERNFQLGIIEKDIETAIQKYFSSCKKQGLDIDESESWLLDLIAMPQTVKLYLADSQIL
jgi:hypothetical protein